MKVFRLPEDTIQTVIKLAVFVVLEILGLIVFGQLLVPLIGYFAGSALHAFAAAAVANTLAMRIYERARLTDIGFAWSSVSVRHLLLGLGGGIGAACLVLGGPMIAGAAGLSKVPQNGSDWKTFLLFAVMILFGGIGEEMLFHGYGFQILLKLAGPWAAILPVSVLFGLAHSNNLNVTALGLANTAAWGVLLGYAFWRSGDLWLPIGLHVGWNWMLPVFGVNLSGFTINLTGYAMFWKIGPLWSGGDYGPEAGLLTSGVVIALFLYLWRVPIERQKPLLLRARGEV